ncbi:MAG: hypothetical protein A3C81_01495 [Candidatus Yanofskybacteria bacterium RIFCSPHIGHO2_02_FULL_46_19]|uniref:Uncharacterized protein n=1 Tax=Candidatus Yanofskybacteria bacterium RIFCSPHIGHO2_02_FULL_46_19 TaxID=1802684 RepID=A0A1F8FRZ7_9BACT|nr:MAG: hypothetical protein A3C81_01495 [Candidatus Yanofskybacteria bacterium RIFCSPHIGHO2_02_FULL_46_19]
MPPKKNLKLSKFRISVPSFAKGFGRAGGIFGQTRAATGGEMRPNYFKNRPKILASPIRLASRAKLEL